MLVVVTKRKLRDSAVFYIISMRTYPGTLIPWSPHNCLKVFTDMKSINNILFNEKKSSYKNNVFDVITYFKNILIL